MSMILSQELAERFSKLVEQPLTCLSRKSGILSSDFQHVAGTELKSDCAARSLNLKGEGNGNHWSDKGQ